MTSVAEILLTILVVWLAFSIVIGCIALWVLWKVVKARVKLPGVHKNKVTKEALRSLND